MAKILKKTYESNFFAIFFNKIVEIYSLFEFYY